MTVYSRRPGACVYSSVFPMFGRTGIGIIDDIDCAYAFDISEGETRTACGKDGDGRKERFTVLQHV